MVSRLVAVSIGVVLVAGALETYYRARARNADPHPVRGLYVLDQYTSHSLVPNLKRQTFNVYGADVNGQPSVKPFLVSTTSDGIRSARDVPVGRRPDSIRIMAMGSSFDFGFGVNDEDTWTAVLEQRLAAEKSFPAGVEVINGGMPGTHNVQFLIRYLSRLQKYRPDVVIIATGPPVPSGTIDMRQFTLPAPDPDFVAKSAFYIDRDGVLRAHVSQRPFWRWASSRSEFIKQMLIRVNVTRSNAEVAQAQTIAASDVDDSSLDPLFAFHERLRDQDVPLFVVIRETLLAFKGTPSPEEIMARKLARRGMPALNLRPLFDRADYRSYLVDDGHWNEAAHRMAADAIYAFLIEHKALVIDAARRHGSIASE